MVTAGDKNQTTALHKMASKNLWTSELEELLTAGNVDLIVHSQKDMPTVLPSGCKLGASCSRSERRDCVVMSKSSIEKGWKELSDLPEGSVVGTSSVRRIAQVARLFPKLKTEDMRGNIGTRLGKLDDPQKGFAALILAATGVQRVHHGVRVSSFLTWEGHGWLGPVGQGALGVEIREGDADAEALCEKLRQDKEGEPTGTGKRTWLEILAERALLRTLEGGCSVPLGVETTWTGEDKQTLKIIAAVISLDGKKFVDAKLEGTVVDETQAEELGVNVAKKLGESGAAEILEEIIKARDPVK